LQRGATRVVALDVGYGQLHEKLRQDERVTSIERVNARELDSALLPEGIELATMDVSFISSTLILPRLAEAIPYAELLVMVKPQFEVGREQVGKGGVVRDESARAAAAERVCRCARDLGYEVLGQVDSRIPGPKGNREIFLHLRPRARD
jgi:23S rRNA (cytidine1920-2'-O)/16S rRNA (cytidine1409-2'-O)-methyltransferase